MIDSANSRIFASQSAKLHSNYSSIEEGTLLVWSMEGGEGVVKPAAGSSTELIAGIARSQYINATEAPMVEEFTIPGSGAYTVTLAKTPLSPDTRVGVVFTNNGELGVVDTTPDATLDFFVSGKVVTFHSADAGRPVRITYRYAPTLLEAQVLYGQGIGDAAQSITGMIEIVTSAQIISVTNYDPTDDWTVGGPVYSGAGGVMTLKTSGKLIGSANVLVAPGATNGGMLSVYISV